MRLQDIIDAGGVCTWSGVQRRPVVALSDYTAQSATGGRGTVGDWAHGAECKTTRRHGPPSMLSGIGGRVLFGKGAR